MHICKFCGRSLIKTGSHESSCSSNPNRVKRKGTNQYTKGTAKPDSAETKILRHAVALRANEIRWSASDAKVKASNAMKQAVLNNPESYTSNNVCGRVKIEEYSGHKFHGKWEVEAAKWFDRNGVLWERKIQPIEYVWNSKTHLYFPDFYLPELDVYVEVKGYETDRDRAKWSYVSNLTVLKSKQIKEMKEDKFALIAHLVESKPLIRVRAEFKSLAAHQQLV